MWISALILIVNSTQQENGREVELGYGVEPTVVTNRRPNDQGNRVLVWYMTNQGIVRSRDEAAGAFGPRAALGGPNHDLADCSNRRIIEGV
jgi:hypothetical protein